MKIRGWWRLHWAIMDACMAVLQFLIGMDCLAREWVVYGCLSFAFAFLMAWFSGFFTSGFIMELDQVIEARNVAEAEAKKKWDKEWMDSASGSRSIKEEPE